MEISATSSIFVIFLCCALKFFGLYGILFFALSVLICLLAFLSVILSNSTEKSVDKLVFADPLSDSYSKTTLGLKFTKKFRPKSIHRREIKRMRSSKKHKKDFRHKFDHLIEQLHLPALFHIHSHRHRGVEITPSPSQPKTPLRQLRSLSGHTDIDNVIHRLLDLVFRDFIDSWYTIVSENRDFSNETRLLIEDSLCNFIKRLKHAPLMRFLTTTVLDDISEHTKAFHDARRMVSEAQKGSKGLGKLNASLHRRNKSESDVTWNIGGANAQKKVANSTFYSVNTDEKLFDPERQLIETFFDITGHTFKREVTDDEALERHLAALTETSAYFVMNPESFECDPLRTLVTSLLAGLLTKVVSKIISDPDFLNVQIAKIFAANPPPAEWLLKIIRQSTDLSELRAVRHLITREMDAKHRDKSCVGEVASLSFTQRVIDMRITSVQNNTRDKGLEKSSVKLPLLTLDEILAKDLALSYYLDYLQVMNLQKYVIFYCRAQDWRQTVVERPHESRDRAYELLKEYLLPGAPNYLTIDPGLVEVLHIKIRDTILTPDPTWFESICKFVYEKLKNERVFLQNFYESPAYRKLIGELEDSEDTKAPDFLLADEEDEEEDEDDDDENSLGVPTTRHQRSHSDTGVLLNRTSERKLTAKIINTAINSDGKFAVYAIHVHIAEQQRSWHVYRRYSKFLELKKRLVRQFPFFRNVSLPFPKKQTFHNTDRDLLERRMAILNEFLAVVTARADTDVVVMSILREFLEPDNDDRRIHGSRPIDLVRPLRSGMRTIKNVPDNVIGGLSRILTGKGGAVTNDTIDSPENPSLNAFTNLLDAIFDLDSRSQWLKRGIHSLISAPFVSQSIARKIREIVQKNILEPEVIHGCLCAILNSTWPGGVLQEPAHREDTTKLRTRMAAKVAIFAFFTDDLRHILGSETTRNGLMSFYEMLQYQTLNKRLVLVLLNRLLGAVFPTDDLTKHVVKNA